MLAGGRLFSPARGGVACLVPDFARGMAGHSKWSTIKRQKGAEDAKRSTVFAKIAKQLKIAISSNSTIELNNVLARAKEVDMPKDIIERAMEKAKQAKAGAFLRYEGSGPHGVSIICHAISDNKARTAALMKEAFNKHGGHMGAPNSMNFKFRRLGQAHVSNVAADKADELLERAIDLGAEEVEEGGEDGEWVVSCEPESLAAIAKGISDAGFQAQSSGFVHVPHQGVPIASGEAHDEVVKFLDAVGGVEDVDEIFHDAELPSES